MLFFCSHNFLLYNPVTFVNHWSVHVRSSHGVKVKGVVGQSIKGFTRRGTLKKTVLKFKLAATSTII